MEQTALQPATTEVVQANISGGVSGQVAVGNYILQIGSVHGGVVNINLPEQKPRLKARPVPVYILPRRFAGLLDRADEVGAASTALPASRPVEFHAPGGTGKTSLLRVLARHPLTSAFPDGVIYLPARGQAPADLLQSIFDSLFEYDAPYKPSEGEIRYALQNKRALILLDDVELGREEVEALFDAAPESTFLLASPERKLWGEGLSLALPGLPMQEARRFLERELGRELSEEERASVEDLYQALGGHPLALMQAAALVREHGVSLQRLAALRHEEEPEKKVAGYAFGLLSQPERMAVAAIAALDGAPLSGRHLPALTGISDTKPLLTSLQKRGLVQEGESGFTLTKNFSGIVLGAWELGSWREALRDYFRSWAVHQLEDPRGILDDVDGILRLVESAGSAGDWQGVLNLVKAVEGALALSRQWGAWEQALQSGLQAAEALGDLKAKAWAMHQLGTRLLSLDEKQAARQLLVRALRLREMLGDRAGAAVTRHNLSLLLGPPGGDGGETPKGPAQPATPLHSLSIGVFSALLMTGAIMAVVWFALQFPWLQPPAVPPPEQPPVLATQLPTEASPILPITGGEPHLSPTASETATATLTDIATPTPTDTPTSTPTNTQAPVPAACVPQVGWQVYVIRRGDTLWSIGRATGSTASELRLANCLSGSRIIAEKPLYVPRLPVDSPAATPQATSAPSIALTLESTDLVIAATSTPTITATLAPPDLVITSLQVGPVSGEGSEESPAIFNVPVSVTVYNQGGQAAGPFRVGVYLHGDYPKTHYVPPPGPLVFSLESLAAGASRTFQGAFVAENLGYVRSLVVLAIADDCSGQELTSPCQVAEIDETNNQSMDQQVEVPNLPPSAEINVPDSDVSLYFSGADESGWYSELILGGQGSDLEDGALGGEQLTWTSDLSGYLGSGSELHIRLYADDCKGVTHTITLTATDSKGAQNTATRRITIRNEDCRPQIEVKLPQPGTYYVGDNIIYEDEQKFYVLNIDGIAAAYDARGRTITDSLVWTVDGKGQAGTGGRPAFTLFLLDQEEHCDEVEYTVRITVTDMEGNQAEKMIPIKVTECNLIGQVRVRSIRASATTGIW